MSDGLGNAPEGGENNADDNAKAGLGDEGGGEKGNLGEQNQGIQIPENWKEALPEDLRGEKSLEKFKTVDALFKSYVHMEKSLGKNKMVIPDKFATEDDWAEVYRQLGAPQTIDEYELKVGKDAMFNDGFIDDMKKQAQKMGLNNRQLQNMVNFLDEKNKHYVQQANESYQANTSQHLADLNVEWGNGYDRKLREANTALQHFGGDEALEAIQDVGLQNNKHLIKMFARIGEAMKEDKIEHKAEGFSAMTPAEALEKVSEIRNNSDHPYNKKGHPNHMRAMEEVDSLYRIAHAKKSG